VFDLTVRGVSFELHETNISKQDKPPSEYFFSVYGAEDDQKWRMCAASKVRKKGGREGGREGGRKGGRI